MPILALLPPANEVWGKIIFLHLFVILFTGGEYLGRYHPPSQSGTPPRDQVSPRDQLHPPGTRYTPQTRCTPQTRFTPLGPGTPPRPSTPPDQVHPLGPGTPSEPGTLPQTRYTPHHRACWEIQSMRGWYASYWNAILLSISSTL